MASIMRPAVLQKSGLSATRTTGAFSANPSIAQALRPIASRATRATIGHRSILPRRPLTAPFHHTSRHSILPPGPQIISGTANDPAPVPKPSPTHGSYHWTFERALSLGLVPLTVAPFAYGSLNPALDAVLVAAILLHSHVGFSSIITDYIPNRQHPTARKTFEWLLRFATLIVGIGFYEFETNDVGLTEGIKRVWKARSTRRDQ